jgi:hypothetical protein
MVYWLASAPRPIHHPISSSSTKAFSAAFQELAHRRGRGLGLGCRQADVQRDDPARWRPRLAHNAHPHQLLRHCGSSGARDRGPRLLAAALRPAHGPLGCGSSGSGVLLALLACLPLGLHVALNLSPIDLRWWPIFSYPHAEVDAGRLVGLGHFRPFTNGFTGRWSSVPAPNNPYGWAKSKLIWASIRLEPYGMVGDIFLWLGRLLDSPVHRSP